MKGSLTIDMIETRRQSSIGLSRHAWHESMEGMQLRNSVNIANMLCAQRTLGRPPALQ